MSWTLINLQACPPGEFIFPKPNGGYWKSPLIMTTAGSAADYRKGNNLARSTLQESLEDVISFTCQRLGNNPRFCINTDMSVQQVAQFAMPSGSGCSGCGAKI